MTATARDAFLNTPTNDNSGVYGQSSPSSLSAFLTTNYADTNRNRKFPTSSSSNTVFGRLGFNFSSSDDTLLLLSDSAKKHLQKVPKMMRDWQADEMRDSTVGGYYENPVFVEANSISTILTSIKTVIIDTGILTDIYANANTALAQTQSFIKHTNRLSNVEEPTEATDTANSTTDLPNFNTVMGLGKIVLYICNQVDGVTNSAPILGSMTSIFVESELQNYKNDINSYPTLISSSITYDSFTMSNTSSLTSGQILTINNKLEELENFLLTRRTHDENFWANCRTIVNEFTGFENMNSAGEVERKILNDYVGTSKYKTKILIEDVPNEIDPQVIVSPMGYVTVYDKTTGLVVSSDDAILQTLQNSQPADSLITTVYDQGIPPVRTVPDDPCCTDCD